MGVFLGTIYIMSHEFPQRLKVPGYEQSIANQESWTGTVSKEFGRNIQIALQGNGRVLDELYYSIVKGVLVKTTLGKLIFAWTTDGTIPHTKLAQSVDLKGTQIGEVIVAGTKLRSWAPTENESITLLKAIKSTLPQSVNPTCDIIYGNSQNSNFLHPKEEKLQSL